MFTHSFAAQTKVKDWVKRSSSLLASMRCNVFPDKRPLLPTERNGFRTLLLSTEDTETNTARRDGGQGPELEARAL